MSWLKVKVAVSLRYPVDALTDPELFGQPVPENLRDVIFGALSGAARMRAGVAAARMRVVRILMMTKVQARKDGNR